MDTKKAEILLEIEERMATLVYILEQEKGHSTMDHAWNHGKDIQHLLAQVLEKE